ncbi:unnamed protein product [Polarella glacialis]|uniref:Reverse transcriptase Ty1/copia-type domain-containing protein n=1 Tax=Polarella glacialis TaxID=89957 RepID=A0A813G2X2_POLGL|nr:unnamed protein product [Polarella glacialis]
MLPFGAIVMARRVDALELGKAAARWVPAVWLGRSMASDEHYVMTVEGVMRVRSVKLLPQADQKQDSFRELTPASCAGPLRAHQPVSRVRLPGTPGCTACGKRGITGHGARHSLECRKRRRLWLEGQEAGTGPVAPAPPEVPMGVDLDGAVPQVDQPPTETAAEAPTEAVAEAPAEQTGPAPAEPAWSRRVRLRGKQAEKRKRDPTEGEEMHALEEEYLRLVREQPANPWLIYELAEVPEVFVGEEAGFTENWHELPLDQVLAGRRKELGSLASFHVYDELDPWDVPAGTRILPSRFLYVIKRPGEVKARLVVQETRRMASNLTWLEVFAACPTTIAVRLVVWHALVQDWVIQEGDVSTPFLHAPLDKGAQIYVQPPSCIDVGKIWKLRQALYGLRRSPKMFQQWFAGQMRAIGFERCRGDPQLFYRRRDRAMLVVHADDLRFIASPPEMERLKEQIGERMKIKWIGQLGPAWSKFLGGYWRRVDASEVQLALDPKHVERLRELLGLASSHVGGKTKTVRSPIWSAQEEKNAPHPLDEPTSTGRRWASSSGLPFLGQTFSLLGRSLPAPW